MISTLLSIALLASSSLAFKVTLPDSSAQCGDFQIKWKSSNDGPYYVEVLNPDDPCGDAITTLGDHDGSSMTWNGLSVLAGTKLQIYVESANDEGWSDTFTVGAGAQDCLPASLQTEEATSSTEEATSWSSSWSEEVTTSTSEQAASSSSAEVVSSSAVIATPSVISQSSKAASSSGAAAATSSAPAIVGAAGTEPGQGDGALAMSATGGLMALSAVAAFFAML